MYRPCHAPVFRPSSALDCTLNFIPLILLLAFLLFLLVLTFGSEAVMCMIRRTRFRMQHCREGNDGHNIDIGFTLDRWIRETPRIRDAIIWRPDATRALTYRDWTRADKNRLADVYERLRDGRSAGLSDTPSITGFRYYEEGMGDLRNRLYAVGYGLDTARSIYMAYVAQSLLVEIEGHVRWRLEDLDDDHLPYLFDSHHLVRWDDVLGSHSLTTPLGRATPGEPGLVFEWLVDRGILQANRRGTIMLMLEWCRRLRHHGGFALDGETEPDVMPSSRGGNAAHWQYEGLQPVWRTLQGTRRLDSPVTENWTGGCQGTTGFLRCVLRTVNIPVKREDGCGHAIPHFLSEGFFLSHGDDPYGNIMRTSTPQIPMSEILIGVDRLGGYFDNCEHVGRGVSEAVLRRLPDQLLEGRCRDIRDGTPRDASEVLQMFSDDYTLAELETERLWERLDEEIERRGGCGVILGPE